MDAGEGSLLNALAIQHQNVDCVNLKFLSVMEQELWKNIQNVSEKFTSRILIFL